MPDNEDKDARRTPHEDGLESEGNKPLHWPHLQASPRPLSLRLRIAVFSFARPIAATVQTSDSLSSFEAIRDDSRSSIIFPQAPKCISLCAFGPFVSIDTKGG